MPGRPSIPLTWRDALARAINERDLTRIEHLIETAHEHSHTRFNDPLVADASFLLNMAQDRSAAHHRTRPRRPVATATRSTMAPTRAGGMSWVAPALASLTQSSVTAGQQAHPLGATSNLRERVAALREMALFPDQKSAARRQDAFDRSASLVSSYGSQARSASIRRGQLSSSVISGGYGGTDADEAATAMGVPSLWIEPPSDLSLGVDSSLSQQNRSLMTAPKSLSRGASPASRSASYYSGGQGSPARFEDPEIAAALRLHSFVHSDEEPQLKSSRLYNAYVAAERNAPREEREDSTQEQQQQQHQEQEMHVSVSPARAQSTTAEVSPPSSVRGRASVGSAVSSPSQSPEHLRLLRKLRHEAAAPEGVEVTRILRFLSATESMDRGGVEQAETTLRTTLASQNFGISQSRGISGDNLRRKTVFMDN